MVAREEKRAKLFFQKKEKFEDFVGNLKESLLILTPYERLVSLRTYAEELHFFDIDASYRSRRQFHDRYKSQWFKEWRNCLVCEVGKVENIHHIVTLKNGGTNDERNLIGICKLCHSKIHPWLSNVSDGLNVDSMNQEYREVLK